MQLARWNPMRDMLNLNNANRFFDGFFAPSSELRVSDRYNWYPKVDIYDNEDAIVLKAELPGVEKDDIVVDVKGRVLTLKGERSADSEVKENNYYRRERTYGSFERRFALPDNVDPGKITADYKNGVLEVGIPKPEEKKPKKITVH